MDELSGPGAAFPADCDIGGQARVERTPSHARLGGAGRSGGGHRTRTPRPGSRPPAPSRAASSAAVTDRVRRVAPYALLVLVAFQAADYVTFLAMVGSHGLVAEANPIVVALAAHGLGLLTVAKVGRRRPRCDRVRPYRAASPKRGASGARHGHPRGRDRRGFEPCSL